MIRFKEFLLEHSDWKTREGEHKQVFFHATHDNFDVHDMKPMIHIGTSSAARARGHQKGKELFGDNNYPAVGRL